MKIKISNREIYLFFLLLPFMEPYIFSAQYGHIHWLFRILKIVSSFIILFTVIYKVKKDSGYLGKFIKKSSIGRWWIVFWIYLVVNTLAQGDITRDFKIGVLSVICIFLLIFDNMDAPHKLLNVLMFWLEILIYANFVSMLLFPNGMYVSMSTGNTENWILGYDNFFEQTFIPALVIGIMYAYLYKRYIRIGILVVIIHLSAFITFPGTLIVALIFIDFFIFGGIYKMKRVFSLGNMIFAIIILTVGIVFFDIQMKYGQIFFELLNKNVTFTGRTIIWKYTIGAISNSPLYGYGFSDGYSRLFKMNYIMKGAFNAHNQFLEFLWEGGLVLIIIFAICTFVTMHKAKETRSMRVTQILSIGIVAIFITFIVKAYIQTCPIWVFILWGLLDYTNEIEQSKEEKHRVCLNE